MKTLEKPFGLQEKTVQYFVNNWTMPKVDEMIEKCTRENGKNAFVTIEWKYIKTRMRKPKFVFR